MNTTGGKTEKDAIGLMHWEIDGYKPYYIEVAAAFDIDRRKVGRDVSETIFAEPNNIPVFIASDPEWTERFRKNG